jgi:hypothetical protein
MELAHNRNPMAGFDVSDTEPSGTTNNISSISSYIL